MNASWSQLVCWSYNLALWDLKPGGGEPLTSDELADVPVDQLGLLLVRRLPTAVHYLHREPAWSMNITYLCIAQICFMFYGDLFFGLPFQKFLCPEVLFI